MTTFLIIPAADANFQNGLQYYPAYNEFNIHLFRSESSPSGHGMVDEGYSRHADSPVSEDPDYAEGSEVGTDQHTNERGTGLYCTSMTQRN